MLSQVLRWCSICAFLAPFLGGSTCEGHPEKRASVDSYIVVEDPIALQGVLNNIGATGADAQGAKSGIVVASPSQNNPDCKLSVRKRLLYVFLSD